MSTRGAVLVRGGVGNDTVDMSGAAARAMAISTDGGANDVTLLDADVRHLGVHTGDDTLKEVATA